VNSVDQRSNLRHCVSL